jgi:hypothetical protein
MDNVHNPSDSSTALFLASVSKYVVERLICSQSKNCIFLTHEYSIPEFYRLDTTVASISNIYMVYKMLFGLLRRRFQVSETMFVQVFTKLCKPIKTEICNTGCGKLASIFIQTAQFKKEVSLPHLTL